MTLRSIYQHDDYRQYLREFYEERKRQSPAYSYRLFAEKAKLGSPNYLKLVIDGTRNLTVATLHAFAKALGLAGDELACFEALVLLNQAETPAERTFYKRRLDELRRRKPERQMKLSGKDELVSHHLFPALVLALHGAEVESAAAEVAKRLGLTPAFAAEAVDVLVRREILTVKDGRYEINGRHYVFHDPLPNRAQRRFLKEQLELSRRALDRDDRDRARFFSHTFTLAVAAFPDCVDQIKAFLEELTRKADQTPAESLVQLNLQLFTLDRGLLTSR